MRIINKIKFILTASLVLTMIFSINTLAKTNGEICVSKDLNTGEETTYVVNDEILIGQTTEIDGSIGTLPEIVNTSPLPRSIIGTDDRRVVVHTDNAPYRFICDMLMKFPNGKTFIGTAWLMSNSAAVTSAHCLYSKENGGYATEVTLWPGRKGSTMPFGSVKGSKVNVTQNWIDKGGIIYDYGVIQLKEPIGKQVGYFGYKYTKGTSINGTGVKVAGYPGEGDHKQYTAPGKIISSSVSVLNYNIDTTSGQSGSPVFYQEGNNYISIGVHGYGGSMNSAKRINEFMFNWINKFK